MQAVCIMRRTCVRIRAFHRCRSTALYRHSGGLNSGYVNGSHDDYVGCSPMNIITLSVGDRHVHYECFALSPGSYSTLAAFPITAVRLRQRLVLDSGSKLSRTRKGKSSFESDYASLNGQPSLSSEIEVLETSHQTIRTSLGAQSLCGFFCSASSSLF